MTSSSAIQLRMQGQVAVLTFNRPDCANALQPDELHRLAELIDRLGDDAEAHVIVLTGAGNRHFCAGLDLGQPAMIAEDLSGEGPTGLGAAIRSARRCPLPILGRINGACVAGGMGLLAACDLAIAVDSAVFTLPEIAAGQVPLVVTAALARFLPPPVLADLTIGARMTAARAAELGLVAAAVPADALDAEINRRVLSLTRLSVPGRMALVRQLREGRLAGQDAHLELAEAEARRFSNRGAAAPLTP